MLRSIRCLIMGTLLVGCSTVSTVHPAIAQGQIPNVLVFTEDFDQDTVPRNSRVSRQVLQEVQNMFDREGYRYFDETSIGLGYFAEGRTRRPRSELIQISRSSDTPIDIAVVYWIYASVKNLDFMTEASMRIEGEMIDVGSGQGLGSFEVEADNKFKLPVDCSRECVLEEMSAEAKPLGRDLGRALTRMIGDRWVPVTGSGGDGSSGEVGFVRLYNLCFDDFTQDQMLDTEELIVSFGGYQSHRVASTQSTRTCYQYESNSDQPKIMRNLKRMVDYLSIRSDINTDGGTSIEVVAIPERKRHPTENKPKFE